MLALALVAATLTAADLQQWIDDQPQVRAYETRKAQGLTPPPEDAFRQPPRLPRQAACDARADATAAAVMLFKTSDGGKLTLTEPDLQARNDGQPTVQLSDDGKKALSDRAQAYEREAGRLEPACIG